jgi:hypothetical protein
MRQTLWLYCSAALILAETLCAALAIADGGISLLTVVVIAFSLVLASLLGRALCEWLSLPLPAAAEIPAAIVMGTAVISASMLILCLEATLSVVAAFLLTGVPACAIIAWRALRSPGGDAASADAESPCVLGTMAAVCLLSVVWSWQAIRSVLHLQRTGILSAWIDFYFHAATVTQFATLRGANVFDYGAPVPLYHYASYLLPALYGSVSHASSLVIATADWCLLGFILSVLGAWVLGAILADWPGAWAALIAVLLVPNAAHYGLRNSFFDYHWLLQISAGLSYGLGLSLLVLGLCILAVRLASLRLLTVALALSFLEALFKMHFFFMLVPAWLLVYLWLLPWKHLRARLSAVGAALLLGVMSLWAMERVSRAPHFLSGEHNVPKIQRLLLDMQPSASASLYDGLTKNLPAALTVPAGLVLILFAAAGILIPLQLALFAFAKRQRSSRAEDNICWIVIGVYALLNLLFPTVSFNASAEEYQHRTFVVLYSFLAIWCAARLAVILAPFLITPSRRVMVALLAVALLAVPITLQRNAQTGGMSWTQTYARNSIPPGLLRSAEYIRTHAAAAPTETVLLSDSENDDTLIGLSDHPGVLAITRGNPYAPSFLAARKSLNEGLKGANSLDEFRRIAHAGRIHWFVAVPPAQISPALAQAVRATVDGYTVLECQ